MQMYWVIYSNEFIKTRIKPEYVGASLKINLQRIVECTGFSDTITNS